MCKSKKFSKSAREGKKKKKKRRDRAQQEAREMIWGVLLLRLSYSEVIVDESTVQKEGKGQKKLRQ